jgi:hypothetical protein
MSLAPEDEGRCRLPNDVGFLISENILSRISITTESHLFLVNLTERSEDFHLIILYY